MHSKESFSLLYKQEFAAYKTSPVPENLDFYYEHEDYISHTDSNKGLVNYLYQKVKVVNLRKKLSWVNTCVESGASVLDMGCGTGDFLQIMQSNNFRITGIERSSQARTIAEKKLGIRVYEDIEMLEDQKFDCITLWHVFEHLDNPENYLKIFKSMLNPNGVLIVAVPNYESFDAQYYRQYWSAFDVPRHLWHFSKKSFEVFSQNLGFGLIKVKGMFFDAFYISLMSEKYKGENFSLIKGICIGGLSNIRAFFNNNYSSMVYFMKKN